MSDIIVPGQAKKKSHLYDSIREVVEVGWNDQQYLQEQYDLFLSAVQQGASKDYKYDNDLAYITAGSPCWNEKDSFEAWVKDSEEMIKFRLVELENRKKDSSKSFPHIIKLVREAQDAGQANLTVDGIGDEMKQQDYELFQFVLRKSLETVIKFKKGKIKLENPELDEKDVKEVDSIGKAIMNNLK